MSEHAACDTAADDDGVVQSELLIQGIHCSGCTQRIERQVARLPGVVGVAVDAQSGRASIRWRPVETALGDALAAIDRLGFKSHPLDQAGAARSHKEERNDLLRRLAVAGIGMMQVTMFAVGTYLGADRGMDPAVERLLYFVSMLVATPVVFFAGAPFLRGAWQSLRVGQPSMDVPIALALLLAYGASCVNYFRGAGPTYFESATMFVFLLLCARFVTVLVRHRALDANLALLPLLPDTVLRVENGGDRRIGRAAVREGDVLRVRPGDAIAADGVIESGTTSVNEALLTGEATLCTRGPGDRVLAGSVNLDGSIEVRVTAIAQKTRLAGMAALLLRAQQSRPRRVRLANRVASYFVQCILLLASVVFVAWWRVDPEQAFAATLAVLVVTCPCALALAIPTALSAAAARLARSGLLLNRLDALETLVGVDLALFDKTGTLTRGTPAIGRVDVNLSHPNALSSDMLVKLVAALERHSNHPLASAFADIDAPMRADNVEVVPGRGIRGHIDGRQLRVGNAEFTGVDPAAAATINVSDRDGLLGRIELLDAWRQDARETVAALQARGIACRILSGDRRARVEDAVRGLGLDSGTGELEPERKLAVLRTHQRAGAAVLAVGDGVNDGALLAGADVSVAMAEGADLAKAGADVVLTGKALTPLTTLLDVAHRVRRIVRQNLAWAIGYNVIAVPIAALGLIGPGIAALGMSISSLVVILNAARIARVTAPLDRAATLALPGARA